MIQQLIVGCVVVLACGYLLNRWLPRCGPGRLLRALRTGRPAGSPLPPGAAPEAAAPGCADCGGGSCCSSGAARAPMTPITTIAPPPRRPARPAA